ncbi:MAG: RIP metalloprotease RseP, partial [Chloroflexota bacterium]
MVRQKGEEEENLDRLEAEERGIENIKSVGEASPLGRIWFLSAGAIFNLISAFLLFIAVGMLGIPGVSIDVADVMVDSELYDAGVRPRDVMESLNGDFFLSESEFLAAFNSLPADQEAELVIRRGEAGEVVPITFTPESSGDASVGDISTLVRIVGVVDEVPTPASEAGILPGDLFLTLNGTDVNTVPELIALVDENKGQEVDIEILREGEVIATSLVPRENPPEGQGSMGVQINTAIEDTTSGLIFQGIDDQVVVQLGFVEAVNYSTFRFVDLFTQIGRLPGQIFRGNITANEARPISIVGISQIGGRFLTESIEQNRPVVILNYIAVISIALGLTNLLPIPALDGGRILFVLIEMVRGRPIPPEREGIVHLLGLIFLLSVTVVVIINDIVNPITDLIP